MAVYESVAEKIDGVKVLLLKVNDTAVFIDQ